MRTAFGEVVAECDQLLNKILMSQFVASSAGTLAFLSWLFSDADDEYDDE